MSPDCRQNLAPWLIACLTLFAVGVISPPAMAVTKAATTMDLPSAKIPTGHPWEDLAFPDVRMTSPFWSGVQRATGMTWMSRLLAQRILTQAVAPVIDGPVKLKLSSFSASDLLHGRVKQLRINGDDLTLEPSLPLDRLSVVSDDHYPLYIDNLKRPVLMRPIRLSIDATVTEKDFNRYLASKDGLATMQRIKIPIPPFNKPQYVDVLAPKVDFKHNRVYFAGKLKLSDQEEKQAFPFALEAAPIPHGTQIQLNDVHLDVDGLRNTRPLERFMEDFLWEALDLSKLRVDRHRLAVYYKTVSATEDKLRLQAVVFVRPDNTNLKRMMKAK
ncbi:MAG: DUF2993 domain-containing protein [Candidatus Melainabacteria bacterium]